MALQLALTTLESLAVMLNERKREAEQTAAFHAKLRSAGNKLGRAERPRILLREDDVQLLEFNSWGQVSKNKSKLLFITCVLSSILRCAGGAVQAPPAAPPQ